MELASDSKDFASALAKTRVAEMQGAKIVPLPSSDPRAGLGHLTRQASSLSPSSKQASPGRHQQRDGDQSRMVGRSSAVIPSGHSGLFACDKTLWENMCQRDPSAPVI